MVAVVFLKQGPNGSVYLLDLTLLFEGALTFILRRCFIDLS